MDYMCVLITGGTANLRTRGFSIFSIDGGSPATWTGYEKRLTADVGTFISYENAQVFYENELVV